MENQKSINQWIGEALQLKDTEELLIPCDSRKEALKYLNRFNDILDVIGIKSIRIVTTLRNRKFWVKFTKIPLTQEIGVKVSKEGVHKIVVTSEDRWRRIKMMVSDGLTLDAINAYLEFSLTEEEEKRLEKETCL